MAESVDVKVVLKQRYHRLSEQVPVESDCSWVLNIADE